MNNYIIVYITIIMEVHCDLISSTTLTQINVLLTGILVNVVKAMVEYFISEITVVETNKFMKFVQHNICYLLTTILFPTIYTVGNRIISHLKTLCQLLVIDILTLLVMLICLIFGLIILFDLFL